MTCGRSTGSNGLSKIPCWMTEATARELFERYEHKNGDKNRQGQIPMPPSEVRRPYYRDRGD